MTQGTEEPALSRVLLTLSLVGAFAFMILHSVLYPDSAIPGLGEILPLFSELGGSLIWFFLMGIGLGIAHIIAMMMSETIAD